MAHDEGQREPLRSEHETSDGARNPADLTLPPSMRVTYLDFDDDGPVTHTQGVLVTDDDNLDW